MGFLDKIGLGAPPLLEEEKVRSTEQSLELIESYISEYNDLISFKNHGPYNVSSRNNRRNMYKFTCKLLSLKLLEALASDRKVKNVFFSPSHPPPGGGFDGISMRYKIYIEYN